jgi:hypothetical protein
MQYNKFIDTFEAHARCELPTLFLTLKMKVKMRHFFIYFFKIPPIGDKLFTSYTLQKLFQ